jgi:hypothetical protein
MKAAGTLLLTASALAAQCSMCRTAVAAQNAEAIQSVNHAILILFVPAVLLFSSVFVLAFRHARREDDPE